jgi:Arc/MetJ family transcription regulator
MADWSMRTTLDLDDDLISALLIRHPGVSKTEAIEMAIRVYLRESAMEGLRRRAGTMEIEDLSDGPRRQDRDT